MYKRQIDLLQAATHAMDARDAYEAAGRAVSECRENAAKRMKEAGCDYQIIDVTDPMDEIKQVPEGPSGVAPGFNELYSSCTACK